MRALKEWVLEIGIKKLGPSAIRGAILGLSGWLVTKQNLLAAFGVISDAAAHTTTIHWDQFSTALIVGLPAITAAAVKLLNHHAVATIKGEPQSGDPVLEKRRETDIKGDAPNETKPL